MCFSTSATGEDGQGELLSEMSEEECIAFIVSKGLEIPRELLDYSALGRFVKYVITAVEVNPDKTFLINDRVLFEFANEIKNIVNLHYGVYNAKNYSLPEADGANQLQYSTLYGSWLSEYSGYNCYSYAIGETHPYDGVYRPYCPGDYNPQTAGDYSADMTVAQLATLTVSDLKYLGHSCVITTTSYSNIMEYVYEYDVICLRKDIHSAIKDFHYMKWTPSGWLHKPGNTHVLVFDYLPYEINWLAEGVTREGRYISENIYYTGTIHYFAFRSSHGDMLELGRTGNHYHSGSKHYFEYSKMCEDCGAIVLYWVSQACGGPPCSIQIGSVKPEEFTE